jgi:hypothetical protein
MRRELKAGLKASEKKRIDDAEKSYRRMWSEIEPFVKPKKVRQYSTAGKWEVGTHEP